MVFWDKMIVSFLPVWHTLFQFPPSVEDECDLDREIHNTVRKIIRDFVTSWFSTVSSESSFETEVQEAMISMAMELKVRARQLDRKVLRAKTLNLIQYFNVSSVDLQKACERPAGGDSCGP